ncbi:hypothetical protein [Vibrio owensii]|uniref:hypothetical protein n=1 Tax=Vibrio harveyi group TaxID=717610 RepID=UPI003CC600B2
MRVESRHRLVLEALKKTNIPVLQVWFHGARARGDNKKSDNWEYLVILSNWKGQYDDAERDICAIVPFKGAVLTAATLASMERRGSPGWWAEHEGVNIYTSESNEASESE